MAFSPSEFYIQVGVEYTTNDEALSKEFKRVQKIAEHAMKIDLDASDAIDKLSKDYGKLFDGLKSSILSLDEAIATGVESDVAKAKKNVEAYQQAINRVYSATSKKFPDLFGDLAKGMATSITDSRLLQKQLLTLNSDVAKTQSQIAKAKEELIKTATELKESAKSADEMSESTEALGISVEESRQKLEGLNQETEENSEVVEKNVVKLEKLDDRLQSLVLRQTQISKSVEKVSKDYQEGSITFQQAENKALNLTNQQEKLNLQTQKLQKNFSKLRNEIDDSNTSSTQVTRKLEETSSAMSDLKKKSDTTTSSIKDFNDKLGGTSGSTKWLQSFKVGLTQVVPTLSGAAVAQKLFSQATRLLSQAVSLAVKEIQELDKVMTNVQMIANTDASGTFEHFKQYNQMAQDLSVSTKTVAEAGVEFLRQGRSISDTNELIKASTVQATLAQIDAKDSVELLTSTINGYKLSAADAMRVVDSLVQVDFKAATSVEELAKALQRTANIANESGVSFERLVGYIATVSETTRSAPEMIGRAFRSIFSRLQNVKAGVDIDPESGENLNDSMKVLERFNIQLVDTNGTFRDTMTVLDEIAAKWETLNNVERAQIATSVAGRICQNL